MADPALGMGSYVGIGDVDSGSTWGSIATPSAFFRAIASTDNITTERDQNESEDISSSTRHASDVLPGQLRVTGSIQHQAHFGGWEKLLKYLFWNAVSPSGSDPYTWTFVPKHDMTDLDSHSGITLEVYKGFIDGATKKSFFVKGWLPTQLTMEFQPSSSLKFTWDGIGRDINVNTATIHASPLPSYDSSSLIMLPSPAASPTAFATWSSSPGITPVIRSATITFNRNMGTRYKIENKLMERPAPDGMFEIQASVEMEFDDDAIWDDVYAGNQDDLVIVIEGATPASETMTITLRNCTVKGDPRVSGRGPVIMSAEFMAHHDDSNEACTVTIINGNSDYT